MNLKSIRERVFSLTDYRPGSPAYAVEVDRIIRDAYLQIWNGKQWTFSTKQKLLPVFVDIDGDFIKDSLGASYNVGLQCIMGSHRVSTVRTDTGAPVISSTLSYLTGRTLWDSETYHNPFVGQPIEILGEEYTITFINGDSIYLDRPVRKTNPLNTNPSDFDDLYEYLTEDFKIKMRYTWLPLDCADIYNISFRPWLEGGANDICLKGYNWYEGQKITRGEDVTGTPFCYINEPDISVPNGEKISVSWTAAEDNDSDNANFVGNEFIELAWAYMGPGGIIGTPSESIITTPGGADTDYYWVTISILGHDSKSVAPEALSDANYRDTRPAAEWRLKWQPVIIQNITLNKSTGKRNGDPKWVLVNSSAFDSPSTNDAKSNLAWTLHWIPLALTTAYVTRIKDIRYIGTTSGNPPVQFGSRIRRIRLYPRNDVADLQWPFTGNAAASGYPTFAYERLSRAVITYRYTPSDMTADVDTVQIPLEFDYLVVYKALSDLFMKNNNPQMSVFYEQKFDKEIRALSRRYASVSDPIRVRGPQPYMIGLPNTLITKV